MFALVSSLLIWTLPVSAASFAWDASARAQSYTLSSGLQSRQYTHHLSVGNVTTAQVPDLTVAQPYYVGVKASNAAGSSGYSNEVMVMAQAVLEKVPYATGKLIWRWVPGPPPNKNGMANQLTIQCGSTSGHYTETPKTIPLPTPPPNPPDYPVLIKDVVPGPGTWYCASVASEGANKSEVSVELPFVAMGPEIAAPSNPRLVP